MNFRTGLLAASLLLATLPAFGAGDADAPLIDPAQIARIDSLPQLYQLADGFKKAGDDKHVTMVLARITQLLPGDGTLRLQLAVRYAEAGDKTNTYETLMTMQKQGFGYDIANDPRFDKVHGTEAWKYIVESLKSNLKPFGEGKVAFTLPGGDHLYEALAFDPKRGMFLVGSVRDGTVQLADKDGTLGDFIKTVGGTGPWSVYALAVDPKRDLLYVATTASVYFKGFDAADFGKAGVFTYQLSSGKLLRKAELDPDGRPRTLSSIAVGPDGTVFAADGIRNEIYRLDGDALKLEMSNPKLTSIRGLAVSGDGKTLYFADYSLGLLGIDLVHNRGFALGFDPKALVLGGIDGLYWYDGTLVAIENGMSPQRVIRLHLDKDGRTISKLMPLDVANPAFALPTTGTIAGDSLYFIANSQRNAYDTYGVPKDSTKLQPVKVFRSNLRFAWDKGGVPTAPASADSNPAPVIGKQFRNVQSGAKSASSPPSN